MCRPEDDGDRELDNGLATHIYERFLEENKKEDKSALVKSAPAGIMRKTKSDTIAFMKQTNMSFTEKLDDCLFNSLADFIIDERRRNTTPYKLGKAFNFGANKEDMQG